MDLSEAAERWRAEGFVILPRFLSATDLEEAVSDLPQMFPSAEEYHEGTDEKRNARFRGHAFAGLVPFPFRSLSLSLLVVPRSSTADLPPLPERYERHERADLYGAEVSGAGPAGTLVAYSTDTFHRGTSITAPRGARFSLHVNYRHADNYWTNRVGWGDRSFDPHWNQFAEQLSPRQLRLFGFPPPGHPYWTDETRAGMSMRYPGMDASYWSEV